MAEVMIYEVEGEEEYYQGYQYLYGDTNNNINIDKRKAKLYFEQAAKKGHLEAHYQLGMLYIYGEPVVLRNYDLSFKLLEIAANGGIGNAQFELAQSYIIGRGINKDEAKGVEYLTKASDQGIAQSYDFLAEVYLTGIGVEKDLEKARYFNEIARKYGFYNAEIRFIRMLMSNTL